MTKWYEPRFFSAQNASDREKVRNKPTFGDAIHDAGERAAKNARSEKPCAVYTHPHAGKNCRCIKLCTNCGRSEVHGACRILGVSMSENRFDVAESVDELLGMMVGCGSMCWETLSGAGEFDSQEALKVVAEGKERLEQLRIAKDVERQAYHRGALEALHLEEAMEMAVQSLTETIEQIQAADTYGRHAISGGEYTTIEGITYSIAPQGPNCLKYRDKIHPDSPYPDWYRHYPMEVIETHGI